MEGGDGGFGVGLGAREVGGGFLAAGEVARAEEDGVGVWGLGEEGGGGVAETLVCTWGGRLVDCGDGESLGSAPVMRTMDGVVILDGNSGIQVYKRTCTEIQTESLYAFEDIK